MDVLGLMNGNQSPTGNPPSTIVSCFCDTSVNFETCRYIAVQISGIANGALSYIPSMPYYLFKIQPTGEHRIIFSTFAGNGAAQNLSINNVEARLAQNMLRVQNGFWTISVLTFK